MSAIPQAWKSWVVQNILGGVDPRAILVTMLQNGFPYEACRQALGKNLPESVTYFKDKAFYQRLTQPGLVQNLSQWQAEYLVKDKAQLLRIDNFMDKKECARIAKLTKTKLRPSEIAADSGYEGFRTSTTCDLPYTKDPAADVIDKKIIDCLGLGLGEKEVIQAQHYAVGQQFKAHTDYFEPGSNEFKLYSKDGGQRTWTFMVYLNEGCEGGETEFVHLGLKFKPKTGTAIVWNNLHADGTPNPNTLHQAHPVTKGEKAVITKWFREQESDAQVIELGS